MEREQAQARRRAELILKVRAGLMSASEAAKELGVSRKTYYKWEQRALAGMLEGLKERSSGRPSQPEDPQREQLKDRVAELERELQRRQRRERLCELLKGMGEKKR
jgi:transposase